jgi:hypothetical protein
MEYQALTDNSCSKMPRLDWGSHELSDRLSQVGRFIAATSSLAQSMQFIRSHMAGFKTGAEGDIAFLLGATRAGKTTAVNEMIDEVASQTGGKIVAQTYGDERDTEAIVSVLIPTPDGFERPIVKIYVPKGPTFHNLLWDVLVALNIRLPRTARFSERQLALGRQLRGQKTRLIIFDDAHHFCERGGRYSAYDAADVCKVLAKTARVQVLCVGLEHTQDIKIANPQVEWSGGEVHIVRALEITADRSSQLAVLCNTLNHELPFNCKSSLDQPEVYVPLGVYCEGYEGRIATLVRLAVKFGIQSGSASLTKDVLARYLRDRQSVPDAENVFLMSDRDLPNMPNVLALARRHWIADAEKRRTSHSKTAAFFGSRNQ